MMEVIELVMESEQVEINKKEKLLRMIEDKVLEILEDLSDIPKDKIKLDSRLIEDLRITSDDLSFVFALQLQKILMIKIPLCEWKQVHTVRDTIKLFEKHGIY